MGYAREFWRGEKISESNGKVEVDKQMKSYLIIVYIVLDYIPHWKWTRYIKKKL